MSGTGLAPPPFGCVTVDPAPSGAAWCHRVGWKTNGGTTCCSPRPPGYVAPVTPLVAAAEATDRLRFGTQVLNVELWNAALLPGEAAAVDVLTGGRLELGFGAGHAETEFRAARLCYPPARERIEHLAEAVPLVRRLLPVSASGVTIMPARRGRHPPGDLATARAPDRGRRRGPGTRRRRSARRHRRARGVHLYMVGWANQLVDHVRRLRYVYGVTSSPCSSPSPMPSLRCRKLR